MSWRDVLTICHGLCKLWQYKYEIIEIVKYIKEAKQTECYATVLDLPINTFFHHIYKNF